LPEPVSLDAVTLIAEDSPDPNVLSLMQALVLPFAILTPVVPGPVIVTL
jgi:hypothetical protein